MKYIVVSTKRTEIVDSLSFNAAIHDFERDFINTGEKILSVNPLGVIDIGENICERCGVEIVAGVSLEQEPMLLNKVSIMCEQSLNPHDFENWLTILKNLKLVRKNLK